VPSLEVAVREMELAPLHDALRADDAVAAVREAAALVGVPEPKTVATTDGAAGAVEKFLAGVRPRLATGKWIDEWMASRALPNADLAAVGLRLNAAGDGFDSKLLGDEHFRRLIGVNTHEGVEWFNKERFATTLDDLKLPAARRRELVAAAEQSGYQLDRLDAALKRAALPRNRTSSARARVKPKSGRPKKRST
jgi:hypothetical protein